MASVETLSADGVGGVDWKSELESRFVGRNDPRLLNELNPALSSLARDLLPNGTEDDTLAADLVRYAVGFADAAEAGEAQRSARANRAGGRAFLLVGDAPTSNDYRLISDGNQKKYNGVHDSKLVRDTWAYMNYKRAMLQDRQEHYSEKSGRNKRSEFRDAVVAAVDLASCDSSGFKRFAEDQRRHRLANLGVRYSSSKPQEHTGTDGVRVRVDRSELVRENIPDGTLVPLGATFVKTWEVRNAGQVHWVGRELKRMTAQGGNMPASVDSIPIPDTAPGQIVKLSVEMTAARVQGSSSIRFKMFNSDGSLCFPEKYAYGLTVMIETGGFEWLERDFDGRDLTHGAKG